MALDGAFLYAVKKEMDCLIGARVEKVYQPSRDEIILSLRTREGGYKLLISASADRARVHLTDIQAENPKVPPMFCMLMRKRLGSGRLLSIRQDGLERALYLDFSCINELGDVVNLTLACEIMGRYSNIIFVDKNNKIIDSLKRIDESKSHIREVLPGVTYVSPPPQDKLNIFNDDIYEIKNRIYSDSRGVYKGAMETLKGVSPIVCRELENGVTIEELKNFAQNPTPCAVITDYPKDYSFMNIRQYGTSAQIKGFDTFSELLDFFYYEKVRLMRVKARSAQLFKTLNTLVERAVRKAVNRTQELDACKDKEIYKLYGDLIASNQYRLQKGSPYYDLENYYDNNNIVRIPADVTLTPSQNSQKYYKEYRKKQVAESKLIDFINEANDEARYLDTVIDALSRAQTDSEISEIKAELALQGYIKNPQDKKKNSKSLKPLHFKTRDGFSVYVGRNNVMNDRLTLKVAKNYDTWFHTQDTPGSHIICETSGREITDTAIHDCAVIAAYYSKARESSNVAVDYTLVKNIKKPNGAKPGFVIYNTYNTEYATPTRQEVEALSDE
ncbi:MAG: NFACT family protein [Eubacterium sp.]